ncbi:MAG: right-handed parallel beta-helix repeat-containing protein [Bacteroidales bacterium]|nr:right-handed parallel beta-helix repeat-containing protein [Bacteroidales bacterium]
MKKYVLIASALCMAMAVSCNKVTEDSINPSRDGVSGVNLVEYSFPVRQELTKSYLDGTTFKWEEGDKVALCYGSTVAPFTYNSETDRFKGEIEAGASGPFYVVSPYRDDIAIVGGKVQTVLPATQKAGAHNADPSAFVAVGQASDAAALDAGVTLRNAFSLVRVTITDTDVTSISFEGNPDGAKCSPALAGPVRLDPASAAFECDSRNLAVTLVPESGTFAAGSYDLAVLPQNLEKGLKIVFKRDGQALANYKISSSAKQLERNQGIELPSFDVAGIETVCYYIQSAEDLMAWSGVTRTADDVTFFGEDIDMSGQTWSQPNNFVGSLDGQNHWIYNFVYSTDQYCGFIRQTATSGKTDIRNLIFGTKDGKTWDGVSSLTHASSANNYTWYYVGVVAKTQGEAVMQNVTNFAKVEVAAGCTGKTRAAGVCGNWASTGNITNCYNYGDVVNNATATGQNSSSNTAVATSVLGGVIAQCDKPIVVDACENYGTVTNNNPYVKWVSGILASSGAAVTVQNCINHGTIQNKVAAYTSWVGTGGVIGYLSVAGASVKGCSSVDATITSVCHVVGGIAAEIDGGTIEDCSISGTLVKTSANFPAGILAYGPKGGNVKNCKVIGSNTISGKGEAGGIAGRVTTGLVIDGCEFRGGKLEGTGEDLGGIAGWVQSGSIIKNSTVSNVTITGTTNYVAGIVGLGENITIEKCSVSSSAITGKSGTAGILGYAKGTTVCEVADCEVNGCNIDGTLNVGGIVGWLDFGNVTGSKLSGGTTVTGSGDGVGGIIGRAIAKSGNPNLIDNCFVDGATVTGAFSVGGIVGYEYPDANGPVDIYNCGVSASSSLIATACDTGGDPAKGDSMIGGIVGWARCSDAASAFKIVNCYSHANIACDLAMAHPSAGGILGYVSLSSAGTGLIQNCTSDITADRLQVGGAAVTSSATQYGALYGLLPDHAGITVSNCYYVDGLPIGEAGAGVVLSGNEAFAAASYTNSAKDKLNLNAAAYTAHTLYGWKAQDSLPVLSDATFTSLPGGGTENYGDETPFTW